MEVMTRQETRAKAAQIKIISDNSDSVNSSFFQFFSNSDNDNDDFLYFDPTTGKLRALQNRVIQSPYQRMGNWHRSPTDALYFEPITGTLKVHAREEKHRY